MRYWEPTVWRLSMPFTCQREKCNSSLWKLGPSTTQAAHCPPTPIGSHGDGWEVESWHAGLGFFLWLAHGVPAPLSYSWAHMIWDLAAAAPAHLQLLYLTSSEAASSTLHTNCFLASLLLMAHPALWEGFHSPSTTHTWLVSEVKRPPGPSTSPETNSSETGGNCSGRYLCGD